MFWVDKLYVRDMQTVYSGYTVDFVIKVERFSRKKLSLNECKEQKLRPRLAASYFQEIRVSFYLIVLM